MNGKIEMPDPQKSLRLQDGTPTESTIKTFKFFATFLPYVGSQIGSALDLQLSHMSERRIRECFERLEMHIKALPQEILHSDDFIDAARRTGVYVMNEGSEQKRNLFAVTLKNYCSKKLDSNSLRAKFDELAYHQRILSELSEGELDTLYVLSDLCKKYRPTERDRNKILTKIMEMGIPHYTNYHDAFLAKLVSMGLIREIDMYPKPSKPSLPNYEITPTGEIFLNWILEADTIASNNI